MRELLLMRHAEAAPARHGADDFTRPLTGHGVQAATAAGRRLTREQWLPDILLCSPARRTVETAAAVRAALADAPAASLDARIYLATADVLLEVLREVPDQARRAMLIAHNPAISDLAMRLQPESSRSGFATAETRHLRLSIDGWAAIGD